MCGCWRLSEMSFSIGLVFFLEILCGVAGVGSPSSVLHHGPKRKESSTENAISPNGQDYGEVLDDSSMLPFFPEKVENVTVKIGQNAELKCKVENLNNYKVAWVRVDTQTILSIHNNVITRNPRISLSRPSNNQWFLHIQRVQPSDRGFYMCQINTDPMVYRSGYFEVVVPPRILPSETSPDPVVREGDNLTLSCDASGHPKPHIVWRREDSEDIVLEGRKVSIVESSELKLPKISRLHMGDYLCVASNGIPPSTSKKYKIRVQFPPMFWIPSQLEGAYIGKDITLECHSEAFPKSINYWVKEDGAMLISNSKYETLIVDSGYKVYMKLRIRNVSKDDFMQYKCVAKNSLGGSDGTITLYEVAPPTTSTTPTTTTELATTPTTTLVTHHPRRTRKPGHRRNKKHHRQRENEGLDPHEELEPTEEALGGVGDELDEERIFGDSNNHISFTIETKEKNMVLEHFGDPPLHKDHHINMARMNSLNSIHIIILLVLLRYF